MATRYNFNLSKKELEKKEKDAEKRSSARQAANKEKSKEEMKKRTTPKRVTRRQAQARRQIPSQVREMMISKEQDEKNKQAEKKNKPTRRQAVQARRAATNSIPKAVRDKMISPAQDAQNKKDEKLRTQNRRGPSKKGVDQAIKTATDKAKSTVSSSASKLGKLARGAKALSVAGLGLNVADVGAGSDIAPSKQTAKGKKEVPAGRVSTPQPAGKAKSTTAKKSSAGATARSDKALAAKAKAYKKTGEDKYKHGKSAGGVSFKEAFKYWRGKGNKTFTWNGKKYSTETK